MSETREADAGLDRVREIRERIVRRYRYARLSRYQRYRNLEAVTSELSAMLDDLRDAIEQDVLTSLATRLGWTGDHVPFHTLEAAVLYFREQRELAEQADALEKEEGV